MTPAQIAEAQKLAREWKPTIQRPRQLAQPDAETEALEHVYPQISPQGHAGF